MNCQAPEEMVVGLEQPKTTLVEAPLATPYCIPLRNELTFVESDPQMSEPAAGVTLFAVTAWTHWLTSRIGWALPARQVDAFVRNK